MLTPHGSSPARSPRPDVPAFAPTPPLRRLAACANDPLDGRALEAAREAGLRRPAE